MTKRFKRIYIEITNVCNLDCAFCPKTKRKQEYMELSDFEMIIDKIKDYTDQIYLHVKGEPLMHPKLSEFLDTAYDKGLQINLVTNGTLISKSKFLLKKPALRQVSFSLHAIDQKYLDDVLLFAHESKDRFISLRLWNKGADNSIILEKIRNSFRLETISDTNQFKIAKDVFISTAEQFEWPSLEKPLLGDKGFCLGLRDQIAILVDGTVVPCCLDGEGVINLGNIKQSTMQEILEGKRAKEHYHGFSNRTVVEDLCKRCSYRLRFSKA